MLKGKIDVLGTEYRIIFEPNQYDEKLEYKDGYVDTSIKKIVIRGNFGNSVDNLEDLESYQEKVLRHEIIHAFLYESGLSGNSAWACNEEAVDWFAIQFPKIKETLDSICFLKE